MVCSDDAGNRADGSAAGNAMRRLPNFQGRHVSQRALRFVAILLKR